MLAAISGWALLSGVGLVIGGTEGTLFVGVSANLVAVYSWVQVQQRRRRDEDDDEDDAG